jgi:hypothetical protein
MSFYDAWCEKSMKLKTTHERQQERNAAILQFFRPSALGEGREKNLISFRIRRE